MKKISRNTMQSLGKLKLSPKKMPDIVGIIIDDVVIKTVMCIGPFERARIE
jgi:hypothetical protein